MTGPRSRTFTILVVENEPGRRHLPRLVLEWAGHAVREVVDGRAALDALAETRPDLIVADLSVPDGADLVRRLRADPSTALIPILAATDDARTPTAADAVLIKPYRPGHLLAAATTLLGRPSPRQRALARRKVLTSHQHHRGATFPYHHDRYNQ